MSFVEPIGETARKFFAGTDAKGRCKSMFGFSEAVLFLSLLVWKGWVPWDRWMFVLRCTDAKGSCKSMFGFSEALLFLSLVV
jgi:hypothetical protein